MKGLLNIIKKGLMHDYEKTLIENAEYVVVDTELTGLNQKRDSIVSIGAVRMPRGRIDLSDTFYRLVNPETDITAESVIIHEITPSDVMHKPDISTVLLEFLSFCDDNIIVGFCVNIDMEFLNREAKRVLGHTIPNPVLDIFPIFEWVRNNRTARGGDEITVPLHYKLYDIAKYYGVEVTGTHKSIIDAFITAQIFQRFIPVLIESGVKSIGELIKLSKRYRGGDRTSISRGLSNF